MNAIPDMGCNMIDAKLVPQMNAIPGMGCKLIDAKIALETDAIPGWLIAAEAGHRAPKRYIILKFEYC